MTHTPVQVPASVEQVIERMREIDRALDPHDGVACFNRMYLRVTELVGQNIVDGFFEDPAFLERMDVLFAGLYFKAVDAKTAPVPWKPLFDARDNRTVWPVQFALAGMNAHINHDLALAVNATCAERRTTPRTKPVHADYLRVNELLAKVEAEVRAEYEPELLKLPTAEAEQLKHVLSGFSIARGRDVSWGAALTLWDERNLAPLYNTTLATLAAEVAVAGEGLLTPVVPPPA
ncbi:hypothetical protein ADK67_29960 [Saccharothrix sp. NRRL B-16348]|uniref:DUF5995 family protein n=1 Tax=Saccharothrix sp. NRRL B-16348 TaxID=1415542 RepID=UPI0006AF9BCD|nr:DUF5995 family protein [Saccharothrix sp. NRRL B-16348]KOX20506.1 hypothetical protein ADK67_29960 [Saccharothrix sp. NRRL B-16348]